MKADKRVTEITLNSLGIAVPVGVATTAHPAGAITADAPNDTVAEQEQRRDLAIPIAQWLRSTDSQYPSAATD